MAEKKQMKCPQCQGSKTTAGTCECTAEWRGTDIDGEWNDCQCERESACPLCGGSGVVEGE